MKAYRPDWRSVKDDGVPGLEADSLTYLVKAPSQDLMVLTLNVYSKPSGELYHYWVQNNGVDRHEVRTVTHYARFEVEGPEVVT